jgi:hypothetical protein
MGGAGDRTFASDDPEVVQMVVIEPFHAHILSIDLTNV